MSTVYVLTLRQLTSKWRLAIMTVLAVLPAIIALAMLSQRSAPTVQVFETVVLGAILCGAIAPLVVLAIAAPAFANANDEELLAGIMAHEIGAYERYRQANGQLLDVLRNEGFVDATVHIARILHLAHLPTIASFYDAYVSTAFEHEAALFDLCECLLDVAADGTPPLPPTVSVDWAAYVQARKVVVDGHALMAKAILATAGASDVPPETRGAAGLRLLSADLSVTFGGAASDVAVIEGIIRKYPLWRYAALVRARLLARGLPRDTVPSRALFDGFVGTFGNDRVFAYALLVETAHKSKAWLEPVVRWLAAEALARPHDIEVWFAFAQFLDGDDGQLVAELSSAIETQSLLVD